MRKRRKVIDLITVDQTSLSYVKFLSEQQLICRAMTQTSSDDSQIERVLIDKTQERRNGELQRTVLKNRSFFSSLSLSISAFVVKSLLNEKNISLIYSFYWADDETREETRSFISTTLVRQDQCVDDLLLFCFVASPFSSSSSREVHLISSIIDEKEMLSKENLPYQTCK